MFYEQKKPSERKKSSEVGIVLCKKYIHTSCPAHKRSPKSQGVCTFVACTLFLATSIMGVKEAPSAPAAPSMGVEEVTATPLEQIMVCVIGIEEPPPASVGVNIYASSPGRAQDLDFSSLPRTTSVRRWRNISGKKFAIGLVFVAIVLAIGLTVALLSKSCCAPIPAEDSMPGHQLKRQQKHQRLLQ